MKTIGLIGGMSWESSIEYYRIINQETKKRLGGLHSAECIMFSFDFAEIEDLQMKDDWDTATQRMIQAAQQVERGGGECIVICTNTMHKMADDVQNAIDIPLLHIADATAEAVQANGIETIGLLGTRFTMEHDFYKGRIIDKYGLDVHVPDVDGREIVHTIVYDELVVGHIRDESRVAYQNVIGKLQAGGAEGVILGCTEIGLLIKPEDSPIPVYDTTYLHAVAAVEWALAD